MLAISKLSAPLPSHARLGGVLHPSSSTLLCFSHCPTRASRVHVPPCRNVRQRRSTLLCKATSTLETDNLKVIVQGRNVKLTDSLREFAEDKVKKALGKFASAIKEIDVKLSVAGGNRGKGDEQQKCEITLYLLRLGVVRAEDVEESLYAAIEKVSDMVSRKMRKVKEKAITKGKWEGSAGPRGHSVYKELPEEIDSDEEDFDINGVAPERRQEVVRTKTLGLKQMSVEDALEQVEQVGHSFYIFRDKDDKIKVLYKREHRGYGIILPRFLES